MLLRASTHLSPASIGNPQDMHLVVNSSFQSKQKQKVENEWRIIHSLNLLRNREVRPPSKTGSLQIFSHSRHRRSTPGGSWCPWLSSSSKQKIFSDRPVTQLQRDLSERISLNPGLKCFQSDVDILCILHLGQTESLPINDCYDWLQLVQILR